MKTPAAVALILAVSIPSLSQVVTLTRDQLIRLTDKNPFERFDDGRPKVPDDLLKRAQDLSIEEVWSILNNRKFNNQFEGNWQIMHPEKKLIGRAVTVQFMPMRPDVRDVMAADAKQRGVERISPHQLVIDILKPGDVLVVDLFGKIEGGTIVGDNLATAIFAATGTGLVVDGAVRDMEGIFPIGMPVYMRGFHPSAISYDQVMLTGVNVPVRIGNATVMPGDVVFGDRGGLYFIPPQYMKEILDRADETHVHDEWTKAKLMTGKYKSSDLYPTPRDPELRKEYEAYRKQKLGR